MYETEKSLLMPQIGSFEETEFHFGTILQEAAWWLYERGNFLKARETAAKILLLCEKYEGVERWLDLSALVYDVMGCVANGTNRPEESEKFNSKQLIIRKEISAKTGEQNFQLGYAFNQMGCSLMMFKKFEKGGQMFRQALDIWHSVPGYRKGFALMEYANLGMSLWLQGKISEAAEVLEEGQRESDQGLGKLSMVSFRPGRVLHALGNVRLSQGRVEESEQFHKDALKTYQGAVGSKYHRTADMCYKLAQHSIRRGDRSSLRNAMTLVDQALVTYDANEGAHVPEIARTTFMKARILYKMKLLDDQNDEISHKEDIELLEKAHLMYRQLVPSTQIPPGALRESHFEDLVTFWSR
ncbi:hypothetical protein SGCOL_005563 [Colletotrichum sp. CLE4]